MHNTYNYRHDELVQEGGIWCKNIFKNQSYVVSSGQTLATNVSMTLCNLSPNLCPMWLQYIWYQIK